jgi:hypothetical protein
MEALAYGTEKILRTFSLTIILSNAPYDDSRRLYDSSSPPSSAHCNEGFYRLRRRKKNVNDARFSKKIFLSSNRQLLT